MQTNERIERFKAEAAELNLKTGNPNKEGLLQILGVVLMVVGVAVALLVYSSSLNLDDQRDIQSNIILAIAMLGVSIAGAAIFLRYSMAKFLRFWLLRQMYEGQSHVDQVVEALSSDRSLTSTPS
jgi:hypothetical protein